MPPVRTFASGNAVFWLNENRTRLHYVIVVRNINGVRDIDIHLGRKGRNGPQIANLFGPTRHGISVRRGVIRGSITRRDLTGPLNNLPLRYLLQEIRQGNTYVNVHTEQHPRGEIRGQIHR